MTKYKSWIVFIVFIVAIFFIDKWKSYKDEKPPIPLIMVDGVQIKAVLADYSWHGSKIKPKKILPLIREVKEVEVDPLTELKVSFEEKPESVSISEWNSFENIPRTTEEDDEVTLSTIPSVFVYVVQAKWNEGTATYALKLSNQKAWRSH